MQDNQISDLPIAERIRRTYPEMTGALRSFADLVLADPVSVARMSIQTSVQTVGVSVATANRFARAIGFAGYAEFRQDLIRGFESAFEPVRRLERQISQESAGIDIFAASMEEDIENIRKTIAEMDSGALDRAVELIQKSRHIFIVGFENAATLGTFLANGLERVRGDVRHISNSEGAIGAARHLFRFTQDDLVIAIAFPRYIKDTLQLARLASEKGIPVLALTDSHRSPLARIATARIYVHAARQITPVSNASVLAVIEGLVAAVAHRNPNSGKDAEEFTRLALPWIDMG
jgi:DNA-binding MurR/RpiR family transcriptional regulator